LLLHITLKKPPIYQLITVLLFRSALGIISFLKNFMKKNIKKIAIIYPPFKKDGDYPLLTQNRQLKFSGSLEVRIFPVLAATMATSFKNKGYEVLWLDGINQRLDMNVFNQKLISFKPDLIIMETKAPVIKMHWQYADRLKQILPDAVTLLYGDHVTWKPEETFSCCSSIDYTVQGGYFDFSIPLLAEHLNGRADMPGGIFRADGSSGPPQIYDLKDVPLIDYSLCQWYMYHEAYLYSPAAYIMSGRGCGGPDGRPGFCTFCVWQHTLWDKKPALRPVKNVVDEIEMLVKQYKVKEIFDDNDSGFIYNREWTYDFHEEMKKRKLIGQVHLSANCRSDTLDYDFCRLLKKTGFRLLKIGIEAGNDATLKKIGKNENMATLYQGVYAAKKAGLKVLLTNMIGYPWQTEEEVKEQYRHVKKLMLYKTRFGDSMQASVVIPYPGTPLYRQAVKKDWFTIAPDDYKKFDMDIPVLKTDINTTYWCRKMWKIQFHPLFLLKSFLTLKNLQDIKMAFTGVKSLAGHLKDYTLESKNKDN